MNKDYDCCAERESENAARQRWLCRPPPAPAPERGASPYPQVTAEDLASRSDLFAARFGSCLNLAAEHNVGPHLDGVINRRAGVVAGFNASIAFSILDCAWTREIQADFIASPAQFARGITMADMESLHRKRE